jgi:hypothetical protein
MYVLVVVWKKFHRLNLAKSAQVNSAAKDDWSRAGRFPCISAIVEQIIYYFIFWVIGACKQAPYKFKKSYGGGFV